MGAKRRKRQEAPIISFKEISYMTLDERIKDVEDRNVKINEDIKALAGQRSEIDSKIQALRDEALKTLGEHKALIAMRDSEAGGPGNGKATATEN